VRRISLHYVCMRDTYASSTYRVKVHFSADKRCWTTQGGQQTCPCLNHATITKERTKQTWRMHSRSTAALCLVAKGKVIPPSARLHQIHPHLHHCPHHRLHRRWLYRHNLSVWTHHQQPPFRILSLQTLPPRITPVMLSPLPLPPHCRCCCCCCCGRHQHHLSEPTLLL
jgi:hypothetical protein